MHLVPAQAMSLYSYFKPTLPSPSGPLAESINPATIKAANEAVKDATSKPSKARGSYHVRIIRIIFLNHKKYIHRTKGKIKWDERHTK